MAKSVSNTIDLQAVSPRRGRVAERAAQASATPTPDTPTPAETPLVDVLRASTVTMPHNELHKTLGLAKGLGMFQAFDLINQFSGIARLKWLAERKTTEDYKNITVAGRDGESRALKTFDDLCDYIGISRSKVYEDLKNLTALGEDFMATAEKLGLGYRDLRMLRKGVAGLPAEERQAILAEMEQADGPEELKDKLQDLRTELAEAKIREKELTETAQAKDEVSKKKSAKLEELETRLERLNSLRPDDKAKALDELNARAEADVDAACQKVFLTVVELCGLAAQIMTDDRATERTAAYVHQRSSLLADRVAEAMLGAGIDVDLRMRFELPAEDAHIPATAEEGSQAADAGSGNQD